MKVLLDTNVLYAALTLERGVCADLLRRCMVRHQLLTCEHILGELQRHLEGKGGLPHAKARHTTDYLRDVTTIVEPIPLQPGACRDPDDLPVLGAAVAGQADLLVTGDKDLLVLTQFQGVAILSPRQCLDRLLTEG